MRTFAETPFQFMINLEDNKEIQTLYQLMGKEVRQYPDFCHQDLRTFTTQVGELYPEEPNKGILFYGRATNGWDDSYHDKLEDILWYQTRRPFFNLIYHFGREFYGDDYCNSVAWGNICKIAPDGGNPSESLWNAQYFSMRKIIRKEVEILSPEIIVLVTGNTAGDRWDSPFFEEFPDLKEVNHIVWAFSKGVECTATLFANDCFKVIVTDRPERRPIEAHTQALIQLYNYKAMNPTE